MLINMENEAGSDGIVTIPNTIELSDWDKTEVINWELLITNELYPLNKTSRP